MNILHFFSGFVVGAISIYWIIYSNYKIVKEKSHDNVIVTEDETEEDEILVDEGFNDEPADDLNFYYVKFPHQPKPVKVSIEEQLEIGHDLFYRNQLYRIIGVLHKFERHSVFVAELKLESNGN